MLKNGNFKTRKINAVEAYRQVKWRRKVLTSPKNSSTEKVSLFQIYLKDAAYSVGVR